jgi:hypothetical protein
MSKKSTVGILVILFFLILVLFIQLDRWTVFENFQVPRITTSVIPGTYRFSDIIGMRIGSGYRGLVALAEMRTILYSRNDILQNRGTFLEDVVSKITDIRKNTLWESGNPSSDLVSISSTDYPDGFYIFFKNPPMNDGITYKFNYDENDYEPFRRIVDWKNQTATRKPNHPPSALDPTITLYMPNMIDFLTYGFTLDALSFFINTSIRRYYDNSLTNTTIKQEFNNAGVDFQYYFDGRMDENGSYYDFLLDSPPQSTTLPPSAPSTTSTTGATGPTDTTSTTGMTSTTGTTPTEVKGVSQDIPSSTVSVQPRVTATERVNRATAAATAIGGSTLIVGSVAVGAASAVGIIGSAAVLPLVFTVIVPASGIIAVGSALAKLFSN